MPTINGETELYGIMGKPVTHSLSPAMHNHAFTVLGLNKVYLPFEVDDVEAALNGFRALGVRGVSVTIPYKQSIIPFLDSIDPVAEKIGAVNTLVLRDHKIYGLNTDWIGANQALEEKTPLEGSTILLLGAGGSARAIGFGLKDAGATIILASRTPATGKALAKNLGCTWLPLDQAGTVNSDALINATSVGMNSDESPMAAEALAGIPVVMDIVYSPLSTRLLQDALQQGCQTINGLSMLLYQGAAQFKLWTGLDAPLPIMEKVLRAQLG
ncbi:MAG: shikimate dehydrogenase [Proteobacteria bacterium]|nr:shikimate dehydrogenase [Pseudomonadota bacterium]MBU1685773.1 shikimate dehydrogenase [Pseudomonadota bacterium]